MLSIRSNQEMQSFRILSGIPLSGRWVSQRGSQAFFRPKLSCKAKTTMIAPQKEYQIWESQMGYKGTLRKGNLRKRGSHKSQ